MASASKRQRVADDGEVPTICVLGATGVGKGSTLNSCFQSDKYSMSSMCASDTLKPVSFVLPWRGAGDLMRGVDLCGFSDSEGRDTGFIESMVAYLKEEVRCVHCFLLLLNSQEVRVGVHLKDMLVALKSVFGLPFMKNVMIGFTRWDYTRKGAILRRGVTREALSANVNSLLRELLGHDHDCECIFLDNTYSMFAPDELEELHGAELPAVTAAFDAAMESVRHAATSNSPFACSGIEGTLAERDIGRDMIERENAAVAQGEAAFEDLSASWEDLEIDEPRTLTQRLEREAKSARDALHSFLVSKTKPDLAHVMDAVLADFDSQVPNTIHTLEFRNRSAASSFNRALRMQLEAEYKDLIAQQCAEEEAVEGQPQQPSPRARFDAIHRKYREIVICFLRGSKGGTLGWTPFMKLQEHMRMEQLDAREKILRDALLKREELPSLSALVSDASALVAMLAGDESSLPQWLLALSQGTAASPGVRAAALG